MEKVIHCQISNNLTFFKMKKYKILFIITEIIYLIIVYLYSIPCLFKSIFKVSCPMCGITRTIKSIFNLDFSNILSYNFFALPLIFFIFILNAYLIYDIFFNTNKLFELLQKHSKLIIILLILNFILNNTII